MMPEPTWDCEAYGAEGAAVDALCFFADLGERVCSTTAECHSLLASERRRIFGRIRMLAAGDEAWAHLAGQFTSPEQLLGGSDSGPAAGEQPHDSGDVQ